MNVFKKINSSNIFTTEKKKTKVQIPQSAQKFDFKQENCYILIDYEIRGDGLLICKISKDTGLLKSTQQNSKKTNMEVRECMVNERSKMRDLWIGRQYYFVNLACLASEGDQNTDFEKVKYVADTIFMVNGNKELKSTKKSKKN